MLRQPVSYVWAHGEERVDPSPIHAAMRRRLAGEPLQYIRGKTEFFGHDFYVDDRVLIPRPETEILVETAITKIDRGARVVDIGTGSGCIAVTLALERPDLRVTATDASVAALAVAKKNGVATVGASDVLSAFVLDLAEAHHFSVDDVRNDLAEIPRVIVLSRHGWK